MKRLCYAVTSGNMMIEIFLKIQSFFPLRYSLIDDAGCTIKENLKSRNQAIDFIVKNYQDNSLIDR